MPRIRDKDFLMRMTEFEKNFLRQKAQEQHISMAHYARCKMFDIPFNVVQQTLGVQSDKKKSAAKKKSTAG